MAGLVRFRPLRDPSALGAGEEVLVLIEDGPALWTWLGPDAAGALVVERSSGRRRSCQCSLLIITTGARSHAPRHSNSCTVKVPEASVPPGATCRWRQSASVTRSAPFSAHESVRHTCSTYFPTGFVKNIT